MASLTVEPPENQDPPSGNGLQSPFGNLNPGAGRKRKGDTLPEHDVPVVLRTRELRQRQRAVGVSDGSLGPCAAEGGSGTNEQAKVVVLLSPANDSPRCRHEPAQIDQRGNARCAGLGEKRSFSPCRESERADADFVVYAKKEIGLEKGSRCSPVQPRPPDCGAAEKKPAPAVRRRITDGSEESPARVIWAGANRQRGLDGEAQGMIGPRRVVLERCALATAANTNP